MIASPKTAAEREIERRGYSFDDWPTRMKNLLRDDGVMDSQMVQISVPVGGTADEIRQLAQWCWENRVMSILELSPPGHTRRVHRTLARELAPGTKGDCSADEPQFLHRRQLVEEPRWPPFGFH